MCVKYYLARLGRNVDSTISCDPSDCSKQTHVYNQIIAFATHGVENLIHCISVYV